MADRRREKGSAERVLAWSAGAVAVVAALAVGGVHPTTQVALSAATLALVAVLLWIRRRRGLSVTPFMGPLALLVVLPALQLVPLPAALVRVLSPAAHAIRDEISGAAWMPLTLDVPATSIELVKALATLGLFVLAAKSARRSSRTARALLPIAVAGGLLAVVFLVQHGTHAQSVLGLYRSPDPLGMSVVATFINKNHGASFLTLAALIAAGLALEAAGWRRALLGVCAALATLATLGAASRSGVAGLFVGATLLLALVLRQRIGAKRALIGTALAAALAMTATLWVVDTLRSRMTPLSASEVIDNPKVRGWRDGLKVARRYLWTGAGQGAFESAVASERAHDEGVRLVYAEECVVQVLADFGFIAGIVLFVSFGVAATRVVRRVPSLDAATLGAAAGVVAVAVHDLADFALAVPGVALPTVVALGVVVAKAAPSKEGGGASDAAAGSSVDSGSMRVFTVRRLWRTSMVIAAVWLFALAGGFWASSRTLDSDVHAVEDAERANDTARVAARVDEARRRHPAADYFELVAAREALRARKPAVALKYLNRALRLHPAGWQNHRLAARALVALNQRRQAALELRLQAETGVPASFDESLKVVGDAIVDSVPQRPSALMSLARWLARAGKPALADVAARRALDAVLVEGADEAALALERLEVAGLGGDAALVRVAAAAAMRVSSSPRTYVLAAETLASVKLANEAEAALRRGLERAPRDPGLLLIAARLAFARDDTAKAIAHLKTLSQQADHASLAHQRAAEELLARIYDKTGEVEAAVMARARARLFERQRDMPKP